MKLAQQTIQSVRFDTTRFGPVTVAEDRIIHFTRSIPGFERQRRFILIDHDKEGLFKWLQSADDATLAFLLTDPTFHIPGFRLHIRKAELKGLGVESVGDLLVLVMVSVSPDTKEVMLNLKAPVVFNSANMRAVQCIIEREDCPPDFVIRP